MFTTSRSPKMWQKLPASVDKLSSSRHQAWLIY